MYKTAMRFFSTLVTILIVLPQSLALASEYTYHLRVVCHQKGVLGDKILIFEEESGERVQKLLSTGEMTENLNFMVRIYERQGESRELSSREVNQILNQKNRKPWLAYDNVEGEAVLGRLEMWRRTPFNFEIGYEQSGIYVIDSRETTTATVYDCQEPETVKRPKRQAYNLGDFEDANSTQASD